MSWALHSEGHGGFHLSFCCRSQVGIALPHLNFRVIKRSYLLCSWMFAGLSLGWGVVTHVWLLDNGLYSLDLGLFINSHVHLSLLTHIPDSNLEYCPRLWHNSGNHIPLVDPVANTTVLKPPCPQGHTMVLLPHVPQAMNGSSLLHNDLA